MNYFQGVLYNFTVFLGRIQDILNRCLIIIGGVAVLALMSIATSNVCLRVLNKIVNLMMDCQVKSNLYSFIKPVCQGISNIGSFLSPFCVPYKGTYELVAFLGAVVTAFALGYTQKKRSHIVVDIFTDKYPQKIKKLVESIGFFICTIFFAIIAWVILRWGLQIARSGEVSETLKIIYYPFIFSVAIGFLILSFTLLVDFLNTLIKQGENR